jgi:hypothetical protein
MGADYTLLDLTEAQLRQLSDAAATWSNYERARQEAAAVKGSMRWRTSGASEYLVRVSPAGAETSLGVRSGQTQQIYDAFHARRDAARARFTAMKATLDQQQRLNRALRVGRTPAIVVRALRAIDEAGLSDQFIVVGTHALYAYETAAGMRVDAGALATRDLDLLFDVRKLRTYSTLLKQHDAQSLIGVLRRADPTFTVKRNQLQTAVNNTGFEIDILRREVTGGDPHPLRMSDEEDDFWAVQASQGEKLASSRPFEHVVIAATGELARMRTLHPLDFVRLKGELARYPKRDPLKARKDLLQADVVQQLWDMHLSHLDMNEAAPNEMSSPTPKPG